MKKNKKIIVFAAFLMQMFSIHAFEWGGLFNNSTEFSTSDFSQLDFNQSNGIYLWLKTPLNKNENWSFSAEAFYKYDFEILPEPSTFNNIADIDLLQFSGNIDFKNSTLSLLAGRFMFSDVTSMIFNQVSDGISLKYLLPSVEFDVYAGVTKLLNSNSVSMLHSQNDTNEYASNDFYSLSHFYVPVCASVNFPVLFLNQSLKIQGFGMIDVEPTSYSRYYGTLSFSGPILNNLYYSLDQTFGTENFLNLTNYSSIKLHLFPASKIIISAEFEYASGENGIFKPFRTVTASISSNALSEPEFSGIFSPSLTFAGTVGKFFFNLNAGLVFDASTNENFGKIKGLDSTSTFLVNIFSDLQIGADIVLYYGLGEELNSTENNFSATIKASLSF